MPRNYSPDERRAAARPRHARVVRRGPFRAILARVSGKGGWTYVAVPKRLTPPITRAWGRTPVRCEVDGVAWQTSVWRSKDGTGFLPVPKRVRGDKSEGARVTVTFEFDED
jgi:hypothetical protein